MINYSIVMRGNPTDKAVAKKAYASAQYSEVMDINRFAEHIASHGCVYKRKHSIKGIPFNLGTVEVPKLSFVKKSFSI